MDLTYQTTKVSPKLILLLYEDGYAETASLQEDETGEQFRPGAFCSLNGDLRRHFIEVLSGDQTTKERVSLKPEQLLASGRKKGNPYLLWYRKPALTKLYFSQKGMEDGYACTPPLLFMFDGRLHVYAVKRRPDIRSKLYQAPFGNIYDDGAICMGTAQVDTEQLEGMTEVHAIRYLESLFFNSTFSHANTKVLLKSKNMHHLWKQLIKTSKPFPMEELVQIDKPFKALL